MRPGGGLSTVACRNGDVPSADPRPGAAHRRARPVAGCRAARRRGRGRRAARRDQDRPDRGDRAGRAHDPVVAHRLRIRAGSAQEGRRARPAAVRVRRRVPADRPAAAHAARHAALAAAREHEAVARGQRSLSPRMSSRGFAPTARCSRARSTTPRRSSRPPDGWSGANQVPIMLDFLARQGVVAIAGREGRHRRWDLAERVYPDDLPEFDDEEAARLLDERRLKAAGIAKQQLAVDAGRPGGRARRHRGDDAEVPRRPRGGRRARAG